MKTRSSPGALYRVIGALRQVGEFISCLPCAQSESGNAIRRAPEARGSSSCRMANPEQTPAEATMNEPYSSPAHLVGDNAEVGSNRSLLGLWQIERFIKTGGIFKPLFKNAAAHIHALVADIYICPGNNFVHLVLMFIAKRASDGSSILKFISHLPSPFG